MTDRDSTLITCVDRPTDAAGNNRFIANRARKISPITTASDSPTRRASNDAAGTRGSAARLFIAPDCAVVGAVFDSFSTFFRIGSRSIALVGLVAACGVAIPKGFFVGTVLGPADARLAKTITTITSASANRYVALNSPVDR